ncbi:MAG: bifunctional acetate--CoA ligase family protein/GNAT family N-acetyltransferase [Neomegalonema sp.]|nr:bifunctional acetate--CoA ligase family protein/GNAT family N-acetyltransferase [Neomegalonema sp.]
MTIRNLDRMLEPKSVALIGASPRPGSLGHTVLHRLKGAGFAGEIGLVNPNHAQIDGHDCASSIAELPFVPDLAVLVTPAVTVPGVIEELGAKGTRAAVVISAGVDVKSGLRQAMLDAAKPHMLRILGPNCVGLIVPGIGLDASFAQLTPQKGNLAILSQSGAIVTAMLDWAEPRGIGFSVVASLGDMADIDTADMLDYLARDSETKAILMYLEQVTHARKFMSAARSAARAKPVIVVKSGRSEASAKAAASHTGALAGSDAVYDAAFRRAGILRVDELDDLFNAAEALARQRPLRRDRLGIVTNGGGAGVLAADAIARNSGTLAEISAQTMAVLDEALPAHWSKGNPIDIIGDAGAERYEAAMQAVLEDDQIDAVLVMNCPTALASPLEAAQAVVKAESAHRAKGPSKPVLACWLGDATAGPGKEALEAAGLPVYSTPAAAIRGFSYLARHHQAQAALMRTPTAIGTDFTPDRSAAQAAMSPALEAGGRMLTEPEAKALLKAYGISTVPTEIASDAEAAGEIAATMLEDADAVVVKILSPDITHKSDIGGVRLNIASAAEARDAAAAMLAQAAERQPDAQIDGVVVQPMVPLKGAHELILGMSDDQVFGPVMLFGAGGTSVEVVADKALALPPLDMMLARDLIEQTRIYKLLKGYRDRPAVDLDAIALTLVRLSQLVAESPCVTELDINPLLATENGVVALDARVAVQPEAAAQKGHPRFALRPYPSEWDRIDEVKGERLHIRPIRPEDERFYSEFFEHLSSEDIHLRFFGTMKKMSHDQVARLTQLDYSRAMAFGAFPPGDSTLLGVARLAANPDLTEAEYAVIVRTDHKGEGLGWALMERLIDYARAEGIGLLYGDVLDGNQAMLSMCKELGFVERDHPDDRTLQRVELHLAS